MLPRVYAPNARTGRPTIDLQADEAHHLEHVLRLGAGDAVAVFDGAGREWHGRIATVARSGIRIELGDPIDPVPEPAVRVILAVGLLKGDQMDEVVRDATMLGVARVVPMRTEHVTGSGRGRDADKATSRWMRVAVASAKQCRRAVVPEIAPTTPFATVVRETERDEAIIATEPAIGSKDRAVADTDGPKTDDLIPPKTALVLVGPEGGWSGPELQLALETGARPRQLGPRTLRAESAPIVLLSALWTEWGWT